MHSIGKVFHSLQRVADFKVLSFRFASRMTVYLVIAFLQRKILIFAHMCMSVSVLGYKYIIRIKSIPYNSFWYMQNFNGAAIVFQLSFVATELKLIGADVYMLDSKIIHKIDLNAFCYTS